MKNFQQISNEFRKKLIQCVRAPNSPFSQEKSLFSASECCRLIENIIYRVLLFYSDFPRFCQSNFFFIFLKFVESECLNLTESILLNETPQTKTQINNFIS